MRNECPLANGDYHWWLQDKEGNIIDLTEEQYILNGIHNCRDGGKKKGPLGLSYGVKTRNIASIILKEVFFNISLFSVSVLIMTQVKTLLIVS